MGHKGLIWVVALAVIFLAGPVWACGGMRVLPPEPAPPEGFDDVPGVGDLPSDYTWTDNDTPGFPEVDVPTFDHEFDENCTHCQKLMENIVDVEPSLPFTDASGTFETVVF